MNVDQLLELFTKSTGVCTDTRKLQPGNLFFALRGPNFDGNRYAASALEQGAVAAVVDDSTLVQTAGCLLVEDTLSALQRLATAYRNTWTCPVVALTGSNGKTTTKELLAACLATEYEVSFTTGNLNNHIGVPLTLLSTPSSAEIVVVEMGANHQGEIAALCEIARPTHGFITNIGRAHLEGFGGPEGVRKGKGELFAYLAEARGVAFYDLADEVVSGLAEQVTATIAYQTKARLHVVSAETPLVEATLVEEFPFVSAELKSAEDSIRVRSQLPGSYNFKNLVQAAAVAHYFKVPLGRIANAIGAYRPQNSRSEVRQVGKAAVLLDAYNANPDSMLAGLRWLANRTETHKFALLGEMRELGAFAKTAHTDLLRQVAELGEIEVLVLGDAYRETAEPSDLALIRADSAEQAATWLSEIFEQSDAVVLLKGSRANRLEQVLAKAEKDYTNRL